MQTVVHSCHKHIDGIFAVILRGLSARAIFIQLNYGKMADKGAIFEAFLQKVLQISFEKKPVTLKTCQKNMTYEELLKFKDIDEAKNVIIEKEIMIVNEDIEEIRKYLKRKFGFDISEFVNWVDFKERFYRRNILVHNSGKSNKLYEIKTGDKNENKKLTVSMEYLSDSVSLFCQMALKIGLTFEEKMKKA